MSTQRKPNTDLDSGPAAVVGWVPGRRRGPHLPGDVREGFPGGAFELRSEGMQVFASFSFLQLCTRPAWAGGLCIRRAHPMQNQGESTESSVCVCSSPHLSCRLDCVTAGGRGSACGWGTGLSLSESAWP